MQLKGTLDDIALADIFRILEFSGRSGTLSLENAGDKGLIVFRDGRIVKSSSTRSKAGIGERLMEDGSISRDVLEKARALQLVRGYVESLGRILVKNFNVPQDSVERAAADLIKDSVMDFFKWEGTQFEFEVCDYAETPSVLFSDTLQYVLRAGLDPQTLARESEKFPWERAGKPAGADERGADGPEIAGGDPDGAGPDGGISAVTGAGLAADEGHAAGPILVQVLEELETAATLNEIMLLMLRLSSELFNRSVMFSVKGEHIRGLGQFGIELEGEPPDSRVKHTIIPLRERSLLSEAVQGKKIVIRPLEDTEWDSYLVERLGGKRPVEAMAAPVVVREKTAFVLYVDNAPESRKVYGVDLLESFLLQTGKRLESILKPAEQTGTGC
ncbi:MAG: DUF4388 domain-containing protein [Thermodesulfobacteriota bacterium]|nr:MAG: DUF4388 domain-containing protein [Thermodesulfobacteriota bacterium]